MCLKELFETLKEDSNRWEISSLKAYFFKREYRLIWRHRWCKYFKSKKYLFLLYYIERIIYHKTCVKAGCDIPSCVQIGGGFKIYHPYGIVINSKAVIGKNCTIISGALIGKNKKGIPIIGDNVYIGAHAILLGNIKVEKNATIGAGAIVTKNVPQGATVVCDAAHIIKKGEK